MRLRRPRPRRRWCGDCRSVGLGHPQRFLGHGLNANYLKPSIRSVGLDPENLTGEGNKLNLTGDVRPKAWRDIWGCGQGIGAVHAVTTTADYVDRLDRVSRAAKDALYR
jgi:nitronate monooxygenase